MKRIDASEIPTTSFFDRHNVPFSRAQFFRYKRLLDENYEFKIPLKQGGNRKISEREELFLRGCLTGNVVPSIDNLRKSFKLELNIEVGRTAMRQALDRLFPDRFRLRPGRPFNCAPVGSTNSLGGFELIVAVAYYLKWPERAGKVISDAVRDHKRSQRGDVHAVPDLKGRHAGKFTSHYSKRADIRASRFASVSQKRDRKNWGSMNIMHEQVTTLERKSLAMLSLPIVTGNGQVRSVNLPLGQNMGNLCGFNYKQATISKFLGEMKYLGIADRLLRDLPEFWQKCWGKDVSRLSGPVLSYYIDGNTKAVWSSKRIKQNKVTMLGRVMGCLEQVFIHDGLGHPVYFETYSGNAPVGEHILALFEKIESTILEVPGSKASVCRAIIMDAASNSVRTLRTFAAQKKYHYITTLDDNQWSERRVRNPGHPIRYQYGKATLRDLDFELQDSTDKGYMIVVRAIKINWDNGKQTVLLTSLSKAVVDASEVVWSYFQRWPAQELRFRDKKAGLSLNRVCGYGKTLVTNERVKDKLDKLTQKKERLEKELTEPIAAIRAHDKALAALIPKERRLREKTAIKEGKRKIPRTIQKQFAEISDKIRFRESDRRKVETNYKKQFKSYRKTQKEWLRLQSKKTVYQLDVELDQIMTYYRASLAHLCAYFIQHFLDGRPLSLIMLFQRVAHLQGTIQESKYERKVALVANKQDPEMMKLLGQAIVKINELKIKGHGGKVYHFSLV